jgi:hypothetical protein
MDTAPDAGVIRQMHKADLSEMRERLSLFLADGWAARNSISSATDLCACTPHTRPFRSTRRPVTPGSNAWSVRYATRPSRIPPGKPWEPPSGARPQCS